MGGKLFYIGLGDEFLKLALKAQETKAKINEITINKNKKTSAYQGNDQQNKKATYIMEENNCKSII